MYLAIGSLVATLLLIFRLFFETEYPEYAQVEQTKIKNIEIGNECRLNSGGPTMTIRKINETKITCTWFDKFNELKEAEFESNQLYFR